MLHGLSGLRPFTRPPFVAAGGGTNPGTTGLSGWWAFDETDDYTSGAADSYSTNDLTKTGTVTSSATALVGARSANFPGTLSNFLAGSFSNTFHQSDFTVGCWVNFDATTASMGLMAQYGTTAATRHWCLFYNASSDIFELVMRNSADTRISAGSDSTYTGTGEWKFVVATRSGNTLTLYIDGVAQSATGTFTGTEVSGAENLHIGLLYATSSPLDGKVDEAFIYTRALSADEITWLYNSGSGRAYADL